VLSGLLGRSIDRGEERRRRGMRGKRGLGRRLVRMS